MKTSVNIARFRVLIFLLFALLLVFKSSTASATTKTALTSGNWSSTVTWGGSAVPTASDTLLISSGITVSVDVSNAICNSISLNTHGIAISQINVNSGCSLTCSYLLANSNNLAHADVIIINGTLNIGSWSYTKIVPIFNVGTSSTVIYSGTSTESVIPTTYNNIEISGGGTKIFIAPITVNGVLQFTSGIVSSSTANPLILNSTASFSGASDLSHVTGVVKMITNNSSATYTFPVGDISTYRPISIVNPTNDTWTASYTKNAYGYSTSVKSNDTISLNHVSTIEYWDLSPATLGSNTKIIMTWGAKSDVLYPSNLAIAHWNVSKSYWENVGSATINTSNQTITSKVRWSSFSPFTLGSTLSDGSLPIELDDFRANVRKE